MTTLPASHSQQSDFDASTNTDTSLSLAALCSWACRSAAAYFFALSCPLLAPTRQTASPSDAAALGSISSPPSLSFRSNADCWAGCGGATDSTDPFVGSSAGRVACGCALGFGAEGVVDGPADFSTELVVAAELDAAVELDAVAADLSPEAEVSSVPHAATRPAQASPSITAEIRRRRAT